MRREEDIMTHIAIINRFNMETGRAKFEDIEKSNIAIVLGDPNEELEQWEMALMIRYFSNIEEYEKSQELHQIYMKRYNTSDIEVYEFDDICSCEYPDFDTYLNFAGEKQYTRCKKCGGEL